MFFFFLSLTVFFTAAMVLFLCVRREWEEEVLVSELLLLLLFLFQVPIFFGPALRVSASQPHFYLATGSANLTIPRQLLPEEFLLHLTPPNWHAAVHGQIIHFFSIRVQHYAVSAILTHGHQALNQTRI